MSGLIWNPGEQVLLWALNAFFQIGFIAAFALVIGVALRRYSAARYWLLCLALILVFLCPLFSAAIQSSGLSLISVSLIQDTPVPDSRQPEKALNLPHETPVSGNSSSPLTNNIIPAVEHEPTSSKKITSDNQNMRQSHKELASSSPNNANKLSPQTKSSLTMTGRVLSIIVPPGLIIWAIGAFLLLIQLASKWYRLSLILNSAKLNRSERTADIFRQVWQTVVPGQNNKMPELIFSDKISGPVAAGVISPKVVLPELIVDKISEEQLRSILIHEMAHISRRDQFFVLLQNIIGAIFWAHPLVRLLNREVAQAREEVCDNYVLATTDAPSYSRTLLTLVQLLDSPRAIPGTVGLFTSRWKLEQRVAGLLDEQRNRVTRLNKTALTLIGIVAGGLAMTAAFSTVSIAVAENFVVDNKPDAAISSSDKHFVYTGQVVDSKGKPIEEATINVINSGYMRKSFGSDVTIPDHIKFTNAKTNSDGKFRIEFTDAWTRFVRMRDQYPNPVFSGSGPGTVIVISAPGYAPEWISTFDANPKTALKITLKENTEPIRGHLVNAEGEGIPDVSVSLVSLWSAEDGAIDRWIHELPELRKQGLLPAEKTIKKKRNTWSNTGKFPAYRHIIAKTPGIPTAVNTNTEGRFQFPNIGDNRLAILEITGPQIATQIIAVITKKMKPVQAKSIGYFGPNDGNYYGGNFTHVTQPRLILKGVVRDLKTGAPISARIMILQNRARVVSMYANHYWNTDPKGKYQIEGLPKANGLILEVTPDVDQPYFAERFDLPKHDGFKPILFDVKLRRGVMFHGKLTDKKTGKPIPNAFFDYFPLLSNKNAVKYIRYQDKSTSITPMDDRFKSSEDGSYSVVGIPGEGVIASRFNNSQYLKGIVLDGLDGLIKGAQVQTYDDCYTGGYQSLKRVISKPGESGVEVNLIADQGESIRFEIVDPNDQPLTGYSIDDQRDHHAKGNQSTVYGFLSSRTRTVYFHHHEKNLAKAVVISGVPNDHRLRKIKLEPTGTVKGQMITNNGDPLADTPIQLQRETILKANSLPNHGASTAVRQFSCDRDGKFLIRNLIVGADYKLVISKPGGGYYFLPDAIKVKPGQIIDLGTVKLPSKK